MALTLNQLIKMSSLSLDVKKEALENLDKLNEYQKFKLSQVCWESINDEYNNKAKLEYDKMLQEMADGEKNYSPDDFNAIGQKIISDLLLRLDNTETKDKLEKVKEELKTVLAKP